MSYLSRVRAPILLLAVVSQCALAQGEARAPLHGVSAVRIANYGAPSVLVEARSQVEAVVHELNAVRLKAGRRGDTKLNCYSTLVLLKSGKPLGTYRVRPDYVVERPVEKGESIYSFVVGEADLPRIRKLLSEIPPAKCGLPAE
jgi:hypothetical protein